VIFQDGTGPQKRKPCLTSAKMTKLIDTWQTEKISSLQNTSANDIYFLTNKLLGQILQTMPKNRPS